MQKLNGISDIRRYFYRNEVPTYFISATNFNLLGMDEWVRNFKYINYIDCFDGAHPNVITPKPKSDQVFNSIEEINNYMLEHKQIVDYIQSRGPGRAVFLFFDERSEELCKQLNLELCFPPAKLREEVDNKVLATRIGDEAGVPSVPNYLCKVGSYEEMRNAAEKAGLGEKLVIQTAFGDSGHTTFFISSKDDYDKHAKEIEAEPEVKIMRCIRPRGSALEACVTRHGTIVGPLMTELVGFPEMTPYKGGWCGNEVFPGAFSEGVRLKARDMAERFGNQLLEEGYRGYFDVDFLIDQDNGEVYLGELNPRICGASPMTNHAAFAYADAPLFLFHLLEFSGVPFELNVREINDRWAQPHFIDSWSQVVIKFTEDKIDQVTHAPATGIYRMGEDGTVGYQRFDYERRAIDSEREAFFMRITGPGDYRYEGADLGILITRGRSMDDNFKLNLRARDWIRGIKKHYEGKPIVTTDHDAAPAPGSFKIL
jgi:hypothetical protein